MNVLIGIFVARRAGVIIVNKYSGWKARFIWNKTFIAYIDSRSRKNIENLAIIVDVLSS